MRAVEGSGVWFDLEAHDDAEQIGDGEHLRTVIDAARFERRIERKGVALADQRARGDGTADTGRATRGRGRPSMTEMALLPTSVVGARRSGLVALRP